MFRTFDEPSCFVFSAAFKELTSQASFGFVMFYTIDGFATCLIVPMAIGCELFASRARILGKFLF